MNKHTKLDGSAARSPDSHLRLGATSMGPVLAVLVAAVGLWLFSGVAVSQIATFVGYEALFVVGPGWLLYRVLVGRGGGALRQLVFGWALGYVLELLVFVLTASLSMRSLMICYPVVVAALAGPVVYRRRVVRPSRASTPGASAWSWAVAAVCVLALGYVALQYFGSDPLPGRVATVSYPTDEVWYLSLAGEARHHWPVGDPTVVGASLPYHWFSSFDVAAISQVTGLGMPLVFFRLYLVPLVLLVVLALCVAGEAISGRRWVGPLAAGLVLLVGEVSLYPHTGYSFANELSDDIVSVSPSFLMGLAFFIPALILLHELCNTRDPRRGRRPGIWIALALLLVAATGAKATILPILVAGLGAYLLWRLAVERRLDRVITGAFAVTVVIYALAWAVEYRTAGSGGLIFRPPGAVRQMAATENLRPHLHDSAAIKSLFWALVTPLALAGAYGAALCGLIWTFGLRAPRAPPGHALLLGLLAAGLVPYLAFMQFGFSEVFFAEYGVVAGCLLAADGLYLLWQRHRATHRTRGMLGVGAAWLGVLLVVAYGLKATASAPSWVYLDLDIALAAAFVLVGALAIRSRRQPKARWLYVATAVVVTGALAKPLEVISPAFTHIADGTPIYSQAGHALTARLYTGLTWIRDHTPTNAVIAVNNYRASNGKFANDYDYSAFAERRVFLEGWIYAQRSFDLGEEQVFFGHKMPFPQRKLVNDAVFRYADGAALDTLAHTYGVRYLLVDRVHDNHTSPQLPRIAQPVFANRDVAIYRVPQTELPTVGAATTGRGAAW